MSEIFKGYEQQYCGSPQILPENATQLLSFQMQIRKIDLEARRLQQSIKAKLLAKLREYKSDLNTLKREFKRISSPNAH